MTGKHRAPMDHCYWVYMMASQPNGTLYIGVTNDLARRAHEHRTGLLAGFTREYGVRSLVWYEEYSDIREEAISREKMLKKWKRGWKVRLILEMNPEWTDLYETLA